MRKTKALRSTYRVFISLKEPHGAVSASAISKWLKQTISLSGQVGSGGSTRSASTSKAVMSGASLHTVLQAGDWARASTFKKFYFVPSELSFQDIVLNK